MKSRHDAQTKRFRNKRRRSDRRTPRGHAPPSTAGRCGFETLESRTMLSADPGWAFAIGGNAYRAVYDVEVGPDDNVYVLGTFSGTVDFDPGPGAVELTDSGAYGDGFIAKYTPDRELIWATRYGGADGLEFTGKVNFDAAGNAYLVGYSNASGPQFGATTLANQGDYDAYVAKLDTGSGQFLWAHGLGGQFQESAFDVKVSPTGGVYVVGSFRDTVDFDPDPVDEFHLTAVAGEDIRNAYVWKLDDQGDFQWARNLGGPLNDSGHRIALGGDGHAYVVGTFRDTADFGEPGSPLTLTSAGMHDIFLVKLEETGGDTVWARHISGPEGISGARIVSDGSGGLVVAGSFTGTVTFGAGTPTLVSAGGADTFLLRWDTDGDFLSAQQISGAEDVRPRTLTLDSGGSPHIGLRFKGTVDFDPSPTTAAFLTSADDFDGAVLKLDSDGNFKWVRHISGPGEIRAWGVDVDSTGNVYVNGPFPDTVTLPTGDVLSGSGLIDMYVLKLGFAPGVTVSPTSGLVTTEDGAAAQFTVRLNGQPSGDVTINVNSTDTSEGTVAPSALVFTEDNWDTPQTVTLTGVEDVEEDGDVGYNVQLSVAPGSAPEYLGVAVPDVSATNLDNDQTSPVLLYFSTTSAATLEGMGFTVQNEDVIGFDGAAFSLVFDGSDVGVGGLNVDAFAATGPSEILMSFTAAGSVPGLGTVDDSDIVKFTAASLGENTSGTFALYFDGSDVGLTRGGEDIDGLEVLDDGRLLISTTGRVGVPGVSAADEDLLAFAPASLGAATSGTWSRFFDGSDVGLSSRSEDVDAAAVDASGNIYLSTTGNFSVAGASGADEDVLAFTPSSLGSNTSGTFAVFLDGSSHGGLGQEDVNAIDVPNGPSSNPLAAAISSVFDRTAAFGRPQFSADVVDAIYEETRLGENSPGIAAGAAPSSVRGTALVDEVFYSLAIDRTSERLPDRFSLHRTQARQRVENGSAAGNQGTSGGELYGYAAPRQADKALVELTGGDLLSVRRNDPAGRLLLLELHDDILGAIAVDQSAGEALSPFPRRA